MNDQKEYNIERFAGDKIKDLEELFIAVYKKKSKQNYFSKKYETTYTGVSFIGYLAYKEKMPVAFYGVIPCFIQYENKIILAAQSADTMTHPEHRGNHLFTKLAEMCFQLCKENGINIVFGFPNQNSQTGFIKLGFSVTETMECYQINLAIGAYKKLMSRIKKRNNNYLIQYLTNENGIDNSILTNGFSGIYRNNKYLQYKTYNETLVLTIKNTKVWISINSSLRIGDMLCNEKDFDDTMNVIKRIAINLGIPVIYFHTCKGTYLSELFSNKFQSIPSFPVIFLNFNDHIDINKIKFTFADIDIF